MEDWTLYKFFKFRYTLKSGADKATAVHALMALFGKDAIFKIKTAYISAGYEILDKMGNNTHPHCHFHFAILDIDKNDLGNMRKRFQRWVSSDEHETRKGNILYSLVEEKDVKDVNRFFRYVWKQGGRMYKDNGFEYERLPRNLEIELEIALAREEYTRQVQRNIVSYEKKMAPDTRDLLFEFLDECNEKEEFKDDKSILVKICEFYGTPDDKGYYRSANKQTILGYLQTAKWKYKLETFEETALKWLN